MNNKKGFTLVELLAVLAILSILIVIMAPTVLNIANDSNVTLSESKINIMLSKMKSYGNEYINDFQSCKSTTFSNICVFSIDKVKEALVTYGAISSDDEEFFEDPKTNSPFTGNVVLCYDENKIEVDSYYDIDGSFKCD